MSIELKVLLVCIAFVALSYTLKSIRKSQFKISDTVFWLVLAVTTFVISIFPSIVFALTKLVQIQSPTNLVFLIYIGFLLYKVFSQSIALSKLNIRVETLTQKIAIREKDVDSQLDELNHISR